MRPTAQLLMCANFPSGQMVKCNKNGTFRRAVDDNRVEKNVCGFYFQINLRHIFFCNFHSLRSFSSSLMIINFLFFLFTFIRYPPKKKFVQTQGYSFQIGYCEVDDQLPGRSIPQYTLYLTVANEKERLDWIRALRVGKIWIMVFLLLLPLFAIIQRNSDWKENDICRHF